MAGPDLDDIRNHTNRKYEMAAEDGDKGETEIDSNCL